MKLEEFLQKFHTLLNPVSILPVAIYAQGVFHLNTWKMKNRCSLSLILLLWAHPTEVLPLIPSFRLKFWGFWHFLVILFPAKWDPQVQNARKLWKHPLAQCWTPLLQDLKFDQTSVHRATYTSLDVAAWYFFYLATLFLSHNRLWLP